MDKLNWSEPIEALLLPNLPFTSSDFLKNDNCSANDLIKTVIVAVMS